MNAYAQINRLMNEYCFAIDSGNLEALASLFLRGEWGMEGMALLKGYDEILCHLRENAIIYSDGTTRTRHLISNIDITIGNKSESASSQCYVTVLQQTEDLPLQPIFSGIYCDDFKCDPHGWYFTRRVVKSALMGDLSHHMKGT
jgi:SnoaL-like domain